MLGFGSKESRLCFGQKLMNGYSSYQNLSPLAGICSFSDATKPGLTVERCVARLKRYHYAFKRLHQIFTARITAEPIYELKMAFSLHAHLCAEHATALRKRVGEMREPPLGLEQVPEKHLEILFDEILAAPATQELLLGLYEMALPHHVRFFRILIPPHAIGHPADGNKIRRAVVIDVHGPLTAIGD